MSFAACVKGPSAWDAASTGGHYMQYQHQHACAGRTTTKHNLSRAHQPGHHKGKATPFAAAATLSKAVGNGSMTFLKS